MAVAGREQSWLKEAVRMLRASSGAEHEMRKWEEFCGKEEEEEEGGGGRRHEGRFLLVKRRIYY
jgi:hypothetical protein